MTTIRELLSMHVGQLNVKQIGKLRRHTVLKGKYEVALQHADDLEQQAIKAREKAQRIIGLLTELDEEDENIVPERKPRQKKEQ